jgi:hypothetical protein
MKSLGFKPRNRSELTEKRLVRIIYAFELRYFKILRNLANV